MASTEMSLKLLVDKKAQRVLFAEATKEFVDFLFHIFSLPLGTFIELVGSKQMVGCLGKLKESIDTFNGTYLQPGIEKDDIFHPKTVYNGNTLLLSTDASSSQQSNASKDIYRCLRASTRCECYECEYSYNIACQTYATPYLDATCPGCTLSMNQKMAVVIPPEKKKALEVEKKDIYRCFRASKRCECYKCKSNNSCQTYATPYLDATCPGCKGSMNVMMSVVIPEYERALLEVEKNVSGGGGYVKEVVTYMVMDDLVVKPMSTISSITLINSFGVRDFSQLQEKVVSFGKYEELKLLMTSLKTDKVLSTLFLNNHHA